MATPVMPFEQQLADKIAQKVKRGNVQVMRFLQRYVRPGDMEGAIATEDYKRLCTELNVHCDDASFAAVAAACPAPGDDGSQLLSLRAVSMRLANSDAPPEPSPLTGTATARVTLDRHVQAKRHQAWNAYPEEPARPFPTPKRPTAADPNLAGEQERPRQEVIDAAATSASRISVQVGADPIQTRRIDHVPPPQLMTVSEAEAALRHQLVSRTAGGRDQVARAMRLLSGASTKGGRAAIRLDLPQFRSALLRLNLNPPPDVVDSVFRKYDTDGDGIIDHAEFVRQLVPSDFQNDRNHAATAPEDPFMMFRDSAGGSHGYKPSRVQAQVQRAQQAQERGGEHAMTVRQLERTIVNKMRLSHGADLAAKHARRHFRYFDEDNDGTVTLPALRAALQRLNVDPTHDAFKAFAAAHDPEGCGRVDYAALADRLLPPEQSAASQAASEGAQVQFGSHAAPQDRWAGHDRVKLVATLENLNMPTTLDTAPWDITNEEFFVPWVRTVDEVEVLLREKHLERASSGSMGARRMWQHFDKDGTGTVSAEELADALKAFNIAAKPEVVDALMAKYDADGSGELDYNELLQCIAPDVYTLDTTDWVRGGKQGRTVDGPAGRARDAWGAPAWVPEDELLLQSKPREKAREQGKQRMSLVKFEETLLAWMSTRGTTDTGLKGLRKLFKFMDADSSGGVGLDEFKAGLRTINIHPRDEDAAAIFAHYDVDGDGYIQFNEFISKVLPEHVRPGYETGNWQSIAHHDPKPKNIMPRSHLLYVHQFEKQILDKMRERSTNADQVRRAFRELDWDRSGFVSPEEFRKWLGRMNFFPDDQTFDKLWRHYDPHGRGYLDYAMFMQQVAPQPAQRTSII